MVKAIDDSMRACIAFLHEGQFNGLCGSSLQLDDVWGRVLSISGVEAGGIIGGTSLERTTLLALSATTSELSFRGIFKKLSEDKGHCPKLRSFVDSSDTKALLIFPLGMSFNRETVFGKLAKINLSSSGG